VAKAGILAQRLRARIELFVCDTKSAREARLAATRLIVNPRVILEGLAAPLRGRGIAVTTQAECAEPPHVALVDRTKRACADLVIKDTDHHSVAQRTFLTNTDWQLIRSCPVPLLLTKATTWSQRPRILAGVDPGHVDDKPRLLDNQILERAKWFAQRLHGELHAVNAFIPAAIIAVATADVLPMAAKVSATDLAVEEQSRRNEVTALAAEYAVDPANVHVEVGNPADLLPRIARSMHADIMVMGTISRSGLRRTFIGNTAERVLEHFPCDALVLKPPNFAGLLSF
jgi:universal stress protein E